MGLFLQKTNIIRDYLVRGPGVIACGAGCCLWGFVRASCGVVVQAGLLLALHWEGAAVPHTAVLDGCGAVVHADFVWHRLLWRG